MISRRNMNINLYIYRLLLFVQFKLSSARNTCSKQVEREMGSSGDAHIPGSQVEVAQPGPVLRWSRRP